MPSRNRQRNALRINRTSTPNTSSTPSSPPMASSPLTLNPELSSSPPEHEEGMPSTGTSPASLPSEGIRIRYGVDLEERERASPSMYPTPLPDEVDEPQPFVVPDEESPQAFFVREEGEGEAVEEPLESVARAGVEEDEGGLEGVFGVADLGHAHGHVDVDDERPLVDLDDPVVPTYVEDTLVPPPEPEPLYDPEPAPQPRVQRVGHAAPSHDALRHPKEIPVAHPAPAPMSALQAESDVDPETPKPKTRRVPSASRARVESDEGRGGTTGAAGRAHGQQGHLRAPEAPRHAPASPAPPRALSALSHTLRSVTAAAATAYAHAYATGSGAHSTSGVTSAAYGNGIRGEGGRDAGVEGGREGGRDAGGGRDDGEERIVTARWDEVGDGRATRRLLTLTYAAGVQVWDASRLGQVAEVVNLRIPVVGAPFPSSSRSRSSVDTLRAVDAAVSDKRSSKDSPGLDETLKQSGPGAGSGGAEREGHGMHGPVLGAGILPRQKGKAGKGDLELGILTPHALYVYDLGAGRVAARAGFPLAPAPVPKEGYEGYGYGARQGEGEGEVGQVGTPCGFEVAERVVVVTTHTPPALVLLARPSLRVLHVLGPSALAVPMPVPRAHHHPRQQTSTSDSMSPSSVSPPTSAIRGAVSPTSPTRTPTLPVESARAAPTPISALHGRLLAFLAPPPVATPSISAPSPSSPTSSALSNSVIGGGAGTESWSRTLGRFFSRSAPAAAAGALMVLGAATGASPPSAGAGGGGGGVSGLVGAALAGGGGGAGAWIRVVDLGPLFGAKIGGKGTNREGGGRPRDVHVFEAGRAPLGGLAFAEDGTQLFAVRRDGLGAGVWALRPAPSPSCSMSSSASPLPPGASGNTHTNDTNALPAPTHLYALRRGRTGAVVEAVVGARDGRFVALATRRRTVHVFAVNPYGGRADIRSHLRARVGDAEAGANGYGYGVGGGEGGGEGGTTEVHALVRIRLPHQQHPQHEGQPPRPPPAPLAIAFVSAAAAGSTSTLRSPSAPASPAAHGVQDVLVFDPADGVLSLRRITLSALDAPHSAISVSLPAAVGRLSMSASPPAGSFARGAAADRGAMEAPAVELGGREAVVATWSLARKRGWAEIRRAEGADAVEVSVVAKRGKEDWLAQAELSTFTSASRVLPRAIYLSHQFAFYTLGEDYHALIRRYQFAIGGAKIDVRRQVEVSAFAFGPNGGDEAFVEGYGSSSSPRAIRRRSRTASSSFDEPLLASALAGTHYRDARPPPVLPMLPNGSPASFRSSMPVRAVAGLGDNVAEGLGRLRREMRHQRQKQLARSPPSLRKPGGDDIEASVPLEFDEEDEDFAVPDLAEGEGEDVFLRVHADREDDAVSATTSRNGEESVASISTPATSAHPLEDEQRVDTLDLGDVDTTTEGEWSGWGAEDKLAVEEAERFDDISVVGFLDEEQAAIQVETAARRKAALASGRTRTKKRRN